MNYTEVAGKASPSMTQLQTIAAKAMLERSHWNPNFPTASLGKQLARQKVRVLDNSKICGKQRPDSPGLVN